MRGAAIVVISICSAVSLWTATPAAAQCSALADAGPIADGDIFALGRKSADARPLKTGDQLSARSQLRLAFVLAANTWKDGALIVKSQHADGAGAPIGSSEFVSLRHDRHVAACTSAKKGIYSYVIPIDRFVNYHFYFADDYTRTDDNLENFHTEVGLRRQQGWFGAKDYCLKTSDRMIRPQFMFDDRRRAPSFAERAFRVAGDTKKNLDGNVAVATTPTPPPAFYAQIVPFPRSATEVSCVLATVDIPAQAQSTTVSVVDVDDAAAGLLLDPQHSRTIAWQPMQTRVHAVRRH